MRKLIFAIVASLALASAFALPALAADGAPAEEGATVFSRVWDFVSENREELVSYAADGAVLAIALLVTRRGKGFAAKLAGLVSSSASERTQTELVAAFNALAEEQNEDRAAAERQGDELKALAAELAAARRELEAVHAQTRAALDALFSVWGNSRNLPNGIKDILAGIYAEGTRPDRGEVELDEKGNPA